MSSPVLSPLPAVTANAETKPVAKPSPRFHPIEKKRRMVEESLRPHASVARLARAHGVNANQVFFWRKQYQQGLLGPAPPQAALLPVQISDLPSPEPILAPGTRTQATDSSPPPAETLPIGIIYLELAKAKLRIEGAADLATLRTLLEGLLA